MSTLDPEPSAQEQLEQLAVNREGMRLRARIPFWYWAIWAFGCSWWGIIAIAPYSVRSWLGPSGFLIFVPLFVYLARGRRVKVPRAPVRWWPTRRDLRVFLPAFLMLNATYYIGFTTDRRWLVTTAAVVFGVFIAVYFYRDSRVVFRDER